MAGRLVIAGWRARGPSPSPQRRPAGDSFEPYFVKAFGRKTRPGRRRQRLDFSIKPLVLEVAR
jgi:hypothetical protein